jgi:hypothetical protein
MEETAMSPRIRIPVTLALSALGALAIPALANDPYAVESVVMPTYGAAPPVDVVEAPVVDNSVSAYGDTYYVEAPIVVTAPEASEDALITADVVDAIGSDPRIPGDIGTAIGVDTYRNDVTLTGRVVTPRQSEIASEDAHGVEGVRDVNNHIRPRVGES